MKHITQSLGRMLKISKIAIFAVFLSVICIILAVGNPHSLSWPLKCPSFQFLGVQCPLCGTQRCVHELLNGNIKEAWLLNPGFFIFLPYFSMMIIGQLFPDTRKNNTTVRFCYKNTTILIILFSAIIWGIVRNL